MDRPHQHAPTQQLKEALVRTARDAERYARTGPKNYEDVLHTVADQFLDELQQRGAIAPTTEK